MLSVIIELKQLLTDWNTLCVSTLKAVEAILI